MHVMPEEREALKLPNMQASKLLEVASADHVQRVLVWNDAGPA